MTAMRRTDPVLDGGTPAAVDPAARAVSASVAISGTRCLLTYVVFPWLLPVLGLAAGVGSTIGLVVGVVAVASNVVSIRRMWRTDFRYKLPLTVVNLAIIVLLVALIAADVAAVT